MDKLFQLQKILFGRDVSTIYQKVGILSYDISIGGDF